MTVLACQQMFLIAHLLEMFIYLPQLLKTEGVEELGP